MKHRQHQSGAILFMVFIAVVLFAGLVVAVTQGNRSSTQILTREQARIHINEVKAHAASLQNSISRLKTMKGCTVEQISFEHSNYGTEMDNSNAPTDLSCHVFEENGAAYGFIVPPIDMRVSDNLTATNHWNHPNAYTFVPRNAVLNIGSDLGELIMVVSFVTDEICDEINRQENIATHTRTDVNFDAYTASDIAASVQEILGDEGTDSDLAGKLIGCITETTTISAGNHLFIVLEPR